MKVKSAKKSVKKSNTEVQKISGTHFFFVVKYHLGDRSIKSEELSQKVGGGCSWQKKVGGALLAINPLIN